MTWTRKIAQWLDPEIYEQYSETVSQLTFTKNKLKECNQETTQLQKQVNVLKNSKPKEIIIDTDTELEKFCMKHYTEEKKYAYDNKGLFKDELFPMYPNELIQPDVYLVTIERRKAGNKLKDTKNWALRIAEHVDKSKKWTSDENTDNRLDLYQDIYASILDPKQDCENHASIVSSIEPEFGIAYGFAGTTGHAWNVFIYKDELWCLETNSTSDRDRNYKVFKYADQSFYDIHLIFTQHKTFKVKANAARFGKKLN